MACTAREAASTTFTPRWGLEPWQVTPLMVNSIMQLAQWYMAGMALPRRQSCLGRRCMPTISSTSSSRPESIIRSAPYRRSSPGWKMIFNLPLFTRSRSWISRAAANSMEVWPSWPQAWIMVFLPSMINSRASISARRPSTGPSLPESMVTMIPVPATPVLISSKPIFFSSSSTKAEVLNSSNPFSGMVCR